MQARNINLPKLDRIITRNSANHHYLERREDLIREEERSPPRYNYKNEMVEKDLREQLKRIYNIRSTPKVVKEPNSRKYLPVLSRNH